MKKGKNTAEIIGDYDFDEFELVEGDSKDRTLILKTAPRSRRVQLIAQGAREVRCFYCDQIRPLAGAEEYDEGWLCEYCIPAIQKGMHSK
jgi:hypothetical protein